jgi:vacuolar-type H+-ATPase subunit H
VSSLAVLLERLRRLRPPPGAPAGVLAVPSAGEDLLGEVAFLFGELDAVQARAHQEHEAAQARTAASEADARTERARILAAANEQAKRVEAQLLSERRAACESEAAALLAGARREAARVLARGRESTPALVAEVMRRIGGQPS